MDVREKMPSEKRLIDADAFLEKMKRTSRYFDVVFDVEEMPTVDAVEVLRCRDCKYWGDEAGKLQRSDGVLFARCKVHNYLIDGRHTGWCPTENDFCSYGERKDGDGNG